MDAPVSQKVADGLYWVPGARRAEFPFCHAYLLEEGDHLVAFDPKCGRPQLQNACQALGKSKDFKDIHTVICTHFHLDHTSDNQFLKRKGAQVWMHEADAPASRSLDEFVRRYGLETPQAESEWRNFLEGFGVREVAPDRTFRDGDGVPGGFKVIQTPGHTPGHCCFYRASDGVVIAGDIDLTVPWLGNKSSNAGEFLRSIERLQKLPIKIFLPGHGRPVIEDIPARLEDFRQKLVRREDQLLRFLKDGPLTIEALIRRVNEERSKMKGLDSPLERSPFAGHFHKMSIRNSLLHLQETGRVLEESSANQALWKAC